jgi:hypothetical protein
MTEINEPWRGLKPGDKVRIVRMPSAFLLPGASPPLETFAVFQALVAARAVLTIDFINDYGDPWTEGFDIDDEGRITPCATGHTVALNDDSWERAT